MNSRSFVIRRFGIASLARWGFVAGALVACLPALLCSAIFFTITESVRRVVQSWREVGVDFLGQRVRFDFVELLHLQNFSDALNQVDALGLFGILLVALCLALALGLFVGLVLILLGLFYNATGRIRIELTETDR